MNKVYYVYYYYCLVDLHSKETEESQMGLTPLKRALVSGGLPMTYKVHNPWAPRRCGTR
jgi:hypothetical protein